MTTSMLVLDLGLDFEVRSMMDELEIAVHIFDDLPVPLTMLEELEQAVHIFDDLLVDVKPIWDLGF